MDLPQTLVRSVMRAFYDTKHILVIDALILHSALRDDDLSYLMGMNTKDLHKLCGKLKEERFLAVHTRAETKEGQQRPLNRTYYYIDYRATVDAIKWRVYLIDKEVQGNTIPASELKEFACPRCKSEWTMMEVLSNICAAGFLCNKCNGVLVRNDENNRGGHEQSTKLNAQFKFITDLLPRIDQVVVPDNTFDVALAAARPVLRDAILNPIANSRPVDLASSRPEAVKGMENTAPSSISVTVTSSDGPTAADKAAEQARKEAYAIQNAMPSHFTHSTITGEQVIMTDPVSAAKIGGLSSNDTDDKKDSKTFSTSSFQSGEGVSAMSDSYFEQLKAEQAREAAAEAAAEEEYDTDSSGDDDFEDVIAATSTSSTVSGPNTSATKSNIEAGTIPPPPSSLSSASHLPSALKKSTSTAPSSGTSTAAQSPAAGSDTATPDSSSGRPSKRVRIEEPVSPAVAAEVESEEEDDIEFEDV